MRVCPNYFICACVPLSPLSQNTPKPWAEKLFAWGSGAGGPELLVLGGTFPPPAVRAPGREGIPGSYLILLRIPSMLSC